MANTKLTFLGSEHSEGHEMQCYLNINNDIYIVIEEENSSPVHITLDKTLQTLTSRLKSVNLKIKFKQNYELYPLICCTYARKVEAYAPVIKAAKRLGFPEPELIVLIGVVPLAGSRWKL